MTARLPATIRRRRSTFVPDGSPSCIRTPKRSSLFGTRVETRTTVTIRDMPSSTRHNSHSSGVSIASFRASQNTTASQTSSQPSTSSSRKRTGYASSGTAIREDVYGHRTWLDPLCLRDSCPQDRHSPGTESTGKTSLAQELARRLDTLWAQEYGRELWVDQGGGAAFADYLKIARTQHRREEELRRDARRFLFCDTTPWTTLHWCLWMHGTADPRLRELVGPDDE